MIRYITYEGSQLPADFNIMTLTRIAKSYSCDITALPVMFAKFKDDIEASLTFVATVGSIALTEGARREAEGGDYKRYTLDDLYDMLTIDLAISEQLADCLLDSLQASKVFQMAAQTQPPKKSRKRKKKRANA